MTTKKISRYKKFSLKHDLVRVFVSRRSKSVIDTICNARRCRFDEAIDALIETSKPSDIVRAQLQHEIERVGKMLHELGAEQLGE